MSKNNPPGIRPGTRKAKALLVEVAKAHGVDVKSLKERARHYRLIEARREYCVIGLQRSIGLYALANVLCRDRTTVTYHQRPEMRRCKKRKRRSSVASHEAVQQLGGA